MTHVWYWKGDGGSKGNLDTLYRGQSTSWWTSFSYANAARQEMMNHLVSANFTVTGEGTQQSAVTVDLTLRPRTTVAEGPGNRNYRLRTMVRPRN